MILAHFVAAGALFLLVGYAINKGLTVAKVKSELAKVEASASTDVQALVAKVKSIL